MRNLILYTIQMAAVASWLIGSYLVGYHACVTIGIMMMVSAAAFTFAFLYVNKEVLS